MTTDSRAGWAALTVTVLARAVLVTVLGLVGWSLVPALLGWESTVVSSGSMTPALYTGDVAVVRPVAAEDIRPGQVLLVDDPDRSGGLRLHRLVEVEDGALRLQGDANRTPDTALVDPAAVHGAGVLRIPAVGLPVVWAEEGRWSALVGSGAGALAVLAAAGWWRAADGPVLIVLRDRPAARSRRPGAVRAAALLTVAAGATWLVPTPQAAAGWSAHTGDADAWRTSAAAVWACIDESAVRARRFYDFQEASGTTALNTGTLGAAGDGTYRGGIAFDTPGPDCGKGPARAVTLDGTTGYVSTAGSEVSPQTFTVQVWFATDHPGGRLFGFAKYATGIGGQYDRHLYMTDAGRLVFGVYNGGNRTIGSTASYADGGWHLATVSMGATGTYLYVDGVQVAGDAAMTAAEPVTGFWRFGWDTLANWPDRPANDWYRGSVAAGALWDTALTPAQAQAQYRHSP
ncbi:Peptidase S24-like [Geodermatophilus amargosae]|uniref:Peptidase S24-like n=1 Tax=Geodermatophilus amargosae TaxID=1296565 RepID=A0A1I7CE06_9ACTN|nr:LamG-like jellyroll fold domain-containing protein [Geodermatophilus amargosae]SFT97614.1 Peptidase S24-like [Geodermatophilus amargosae]